MKLYIVPAAGKDFQGDGIYYLMTREGEVLASHWCSHVSYAKGDLVENRPERKKEYEKRFNSYEILHLGDDDVSEHEILENNQEFYKEEIAKQKEKEDQ